VLVVVMVNNKPPLIKVHRKVTSSFGDLEDGPAWAVVTRASRGFLFRLWYSGKKWG
jgi:hypothetical protein